MLLLVPGGPAGRPGRSVAGLGRPSSGLPRPPPRTVAALAAQSFPGCPGLMESNSGSDKEHCRRLSRQRDSWLRPSGSAAMR